ncbi:putative membrane protein [Actinoplanes philippinensis]|uniref:Putative membrane protein n=1 Tax=Actinoplanes philippinensis TaxID=35752 RepID=A0A1I2IXU1_9ACTN|nr:putative membrane protein [Actinoplanes philippinensis]
MIFTLGATALIGLSPVSAAAAPARPETAGSSVTAGRPVSPEAEFLIAVHQGNLSQIEVGRLAAKKSENRTVRKLGKRFAAYHLKLDAQVRQVAEALDVRLPAEPNSEQLTLAEQYRTATAAGFDTLFIDTQLSNYERAEKLARLVLAVSKDPSIAKIVAAARPVIEKNRAALAAAREALARR